MIKIDPKDYGIWYIDAMDKQDRYEGKVVEFTGMVLKSPEFPKNYFVPGRMAMTCCEADMTFLGFICKAREARNLSNSEEAAVGRLCGFPCIQKGLPVKALADINKRNGLHEPYEI